MKRFLLLLVFSAGLARVAAIQPGVLVVVGGGTIPPGAYPTMVELGGGKRARVVMSRSPREKQTMAPRH